jgi:hypothetical protein
VQSPRPIDEKQQLVLQVGLHCGTPYRGTRVPRSSPAKALWIAQTPPSEQSLRAMPPAQHLTCRGRGRPAPGRRCLATRMDAPPCERPPPPPSPRMRMRMHAGGGGHSGRIPAAGRGGGDGRPLKPEGRAAAGATPQRRSVAAQHLPRSSAAAAPPRSKGSAARRSAVATGPLPPAAPTSPRACLGRGRAGHQALCAAPASAEGCVQLPCHAPLVAS